MSQSTSPSSVSNDPKTPKFFQLSDRLVAMKRVDSIRNYCTQDKSLRFTVSSGNHNDEFYNSVDQCEASYKRLASMLNASKVKADSCKCLQ